MRILTNSSTNYKGLIGIIEADEAAPQHAIFCIPVDHSTAININSLYEFERIFGDGITTKIKVHNSIYELDLNFFNNFSTKTSQIYEIPSFVATIKSYSINFYLSPLNFFNCDPRNKISIDYFYDGNFFTELYNKNFIILEPNWNQLDELFIKEKILFTDWK